MTRDEALTLSGKELDSVGLSEIVEALLAEKDRAGFYFGLLVGAAHGIHDNVIKRALQERARKAENGND